MLDVETWDRGPHKYDVVSCLNVLDRCSRPLSLLRQMADKLDSGGLLVLALVFPFEPFVENGVYMRACITHSIIHSETFPTLQCC